MSLAREIKKRNAFDDPRREAMLGILRTSDLLENRINRRLREYSLTMSQYNAMRILRGEGSPLPVLEVARRMIQVAPAITRVVNQLIEAKLIKKHRCPHDGRVFRVGLTAKGTRLLDKLDAPIDELHQTLLASLSDRQVSTLIRTLDAVRDGID